MEKLLTHFNLEIEYKRWKAGGISKLKIAQQYRMSYGQVAGLFYRFEHKNIKPSKVLGLSSKRKSNRVVVEPQEPYAEESDGELYASAVTPAIKTLEELITACNIDLSYWKVDRWEVKTYQGYRRDESKHLYFDGGKISGTADDDGNIRLVTMYAVKAWLIIKEEKAYEDVVEKLVSRIKELPKEHPIKYNRPKGDYLFIPGMFDVHFGRLSIFGNYAPYQTAADFDKTGDVLIGRASSIGMQISRILLPVGNDALNADNLNNTTTRGTAQEMSGGMRDVIDAATQSYINLIEKLIQVAPVDVIVVEGNHDRLSCYWLGVVLKERFALHHYAKYINVDNSKGSPRKYYKFGQNLIGMEHGDRAKEEKLPMFMAQEARQYWADTKYRTFLRGHFHEKKISFVPMSIEGGVSIITFPAFCPPDEWETVMGFYNHERAAEGLLFHHDRGPAVTFPIFVNEITKKQVIEYKEKIVA